MIVGIGTDLAEVERIERSINQFGRRFLERIYTQGELTFVEGSAHAAERFAARFAAKEAGLKALGAPWKEGITWHDFEVINEASGLPRLKLHGAALRLAGARGVSRVSLSLTHTSQLALAFVVMETGDQPLL